MKAPRVGLMAARVLAGVTSTDDIYRLMVARFLPDAPPLVAGGGPQPTPTVPRCAGRRATIVGTAGPDVLRGTRGRDRLIGGAGRDTCVGSAGPDRAKACERRRSL